MLALIVLLLPFASASRELREALEGAEFPVREALERSVGRHEKAKTLFEAHGHLLPGELRDRARSLLDRHGRAVAAAAAGGPPRALDALARKEAHALESYRRLGGDAAARRARAALPPPSPRAKARATAASLFAATGIDSGEPAWGAPFRAVDGLFGGEVPLEAVGVSAKVRGGDVSAGRYHVALQPPCDCWTFGPEAVAAAARDVAERLDAPPLVHAWIDALEAGASLPSVGFGVDKDANAAKVYVAAYGGRALPALPGAEALESGANRMASLEWRLGAPEVSLRHYAVADPDATAARRLEAFVDGGAVAALAALGDVASEDVSVTPPFLSGDETPRASPEKSKAGLKLKGAGPGASPDAEAALAAALALGGAADAWLASSRAVDHAVSNVQFGPGFATLYRHPTSFGHVDADAPAQRRALRAAVAAPARRRLLVREEESALPFTACEQAIDDFEQDAIWGDAAEGTCKGATDAIEDRGDPRYECPLACRSAIAELAERCSSCAQVHKACDDVVDYDAFDHPKLRRRFTTVVAGDLGEACRYHLENNGLFDGELDCYAADASASEATVTCAAAAEDVDASTAAEFEANFKAKFEAELARDEPCAYDAAASSANLGSAIVEDGDTTWSDVEPLSDVPADRRYTRPYGDAGFLETMETWGPDACLYPHYGYMPDAPLCDECAAVAEARDTIAQGMWDGPCVDSEFDAVDDDAAAFGVSYPDHFPGCGCDCADHADRVDAHCAVDECAEVGKIYGTTCPSNAGACGAEDESLWGYEHACFEADGSRAAGVCYDTLDRVPAIDGGDELDEAEHAEEDEHHDDHGGDELDEDDHGDELDEAEHAAVDCVAANCPEGFDTEYYSYSYLGDDDWFDGTCDSVEGALDFTFLCQSADATCGECQSAVRAYSELLWETQALSIGLVCDLDCPAYGAAAEDTHDDHDGHDHGAAMPAESDGAAKIGAAAASALAAAFAFL